MHSNALTPIKLKQETVASAYSLRLLPTLKGAVIAAKQKGINLNKLVNEALEQYLKSSM